MWPNWKKLNCDKTRTLKLWQNLRTQILTKLKPSNFDKTQKIKLWTNSKPKIVRTQNLKLWRRKKLKLKFWHHSSYYKTQNSNCDKTHKLNMISKNNLTPPKPMRFFRAAFRDLAMFSSGLVFPYPVEYGWPSRPRPSQRLNRFSRLPLMVKNWKLFPIVDFDRSN